MENQCPSSEKCPIFNGVLSGKETTSELYIKQYCEAGQEKWNKCKRYLTKQRFGTCPENLLPNSFKTVEEIGIFYKLV